MNRIKISENHESTRAPFWIIIDPKQNFKTDEDGAYNVAGMITGVFFSRESATYFLKATRYNFSRNAVVYCASGVYSQEWIDAVENKKRKPDSNGTLHLTDSELREFEKFFPNNYKTERVCIKNGMIASIFRRKDVAGNYQESEGACIFDFKPIVWLAERFDLTGGE